MKQLLSLVIVGIFLSVGQVAFAKSEVVPDKQEIVKAEVLEVLEQKHEPVAGTDVSGDVQTIRIKLLEGESKGREVTVENDYLMLKKGETFYLLHTTNTVDNVEYFSVKEPYRLPQIITLVVIFVALVLIFGGIQGIRGLVSLVGSFVLILYVLLPGILSGYSPLVIVIAVSSLIIILGSYVTHGFNKTTSSAVIGMIVTVVITGLFAYLAVIWTKLSGFSSEEVVYLNFNTRGSLDIVGLLLSGIIIGLLGVLYDVAIGQAISVEELKLMAPHAPRRKVYERAVRIGREHIGALVNTLAIAYVGASLPLLLLFYTSSAQSVGSIMNMEVFATEIVRTMIGSIGLVLAVPITTFIAVMMLIKKPTQELSKEEIEEQLEKLAALEHSHGHHH